MRKMHYQLSTFFLRKTSFLLPAMIVPAIVTLRHPYRFTKPDEIGPVMMNVTDD